MFEKIAEELKQAREKAEITPEQIASKIRIDLKFLRKMEKGDFSFIPDIYMQAFLKEYAKAVGLDETLILKKYKLAKEGKPIEEAEIIELPPPPKLETEKYEEPVLRPPATYYPPSQIKKEKIPSIIDYNTYEKPEPTTKSLIKKNQFYILTGVGVALLLIIIYLLFIRKSSEEIITETPIEESIKENKQRFVEEEQKPVISDTTKSASDSLTLHFIAKDSSWLKVTFDGVNIKEYYLYKRNDLQIKAAQSFNLIIGNPGGLEVTLNDKPIDLKQKDKRVSRVIVDKSGVKFEDQQTTVKDQSAR